MLGLQSTRGGSPLHTAAGSRIRAADRDGVEMPAGAGMTGDEGAVVKETQVTVDFFSLDLASNSARFVAA